jgi:hypoxanthine phosphoribosyltransferase
MQIIGDVKNKNVILIDDMVDTAGTITKAADIMKEAGAISVRAIASHCVMSGPASEEYRDHQGNSWIYNAMLMRWALMPSMANGLSTTHYYYPKSDSWTDANGMKVDAPSKVNVGAKSSTKSKSSGSVFGKTRRSSGVHS